MPRQSQYECSGCFGTTSVELTYTFQILPGAYDPCCCSAPRLGAPPRVHHDQQVTQAANHITVAVDPVCVCPDICTAKEAERMSHYRSWRCLYLWKCGRRTIAIM